jgi:hypothetical protein
MSYAHLMTIAELSEEMSIDVTMSPWWPQLCVGRSTTS